MTRKPWPWRGPRGSGQEVTALNGPGGTYLLIGDWETSIQYFQQALPLINKLGDRLKEARTLINLGDALRRLKRFDEAGKTFGQALTLGRRRGTRSARRRLLRPLHSCTSRTGSRSGPWSGPVRLFGWRRDSRSGSSNRSTPWAALTGS